MRQERGSNGSTRSSALWGKGPKGETRSSALWGKGGRGFAALTVLVLALVAPATAGAGAFVPQGLLDRAAADPAAQLDVIIVGAPGVDAHEIEGEKMRGRHGKRFGRVHDEYEDVLDGVAARVTGAGLLALAREKGIASITPDAPVVATSASFSPLELWPHAVGASQLWGDLESRRGRDRMPAIAVVDSGVDSGLADHFGGRVVASLDFTRGAREEDDLGHGTMVAAIAAGSSTSYPGVAPTADIVSLRVLDEEGKGRVSDVLAATEWLAKHGKKKGIRVANFSVNSPHPNWGLHDPLNAAVRQLWIRGTVVVASAGNNGSSRMLYAPASDPFVITVGATDIAGTANTADDRNAPWSSYGYTAEGFAKPEVAAPGRYMVAGVPEGSTLTGLFPERVTAPGHMWMSGTSFAAAVASGSAAQILARHPKWTPDEVKGALMLTARPLPLAEPMSVGVGQIDVAAAAALSNAPDANAHLEPFVRSRGRHAGFDAAAWARVARADASWANASWANASWANASWANASWANASWANASWANASWSSASWANASWANASWANASWASASWASASWANAGWVE
ncbi:MAG: S8 family serine peptidase [Gaiellaceae bacterium]